MQNLSLKRFATFDLGRWIWLRSAKFARFVAQPRALDLASFGEIRAVRRSASGAGFGFVRRKSRGSSFGLGRGDWLRLAKIARFVPRPRRGRLASFGQNRAVRGVF